MDPGWSLPRTPIRGRGDGDVREASGSFRLENALGCVRYSESRSDESWLRTQSPSSSPSPSRRRTAMRCPMACAWRPGTGCCRMGSGRWWRPGSWTGRGWRRGGMIWGCGGELSGTLRITFISWRLWPVRTAGGLAPGMTSSGCGKPARTPSAGAGCGQYFGLPVSADRPCRHGGADS